MFRDMLAAAVFGDPEPSHHRWQSKPQSHQGDEDDAEGDEQDHVAVRKGLAARQRKRQRQRRGQRHRAAHAGEGDHEYGLPGWRRITFTDSPADQTRQIGRGIDPGKACNDYDNRDQRGGKQDVLQRKRLRFLEQQPHLESRQQEQQALDQIDHEVPKEDALQARRR